MVTSRRQTAQQVFLRGFTGYFGHMYPGDFALSTPNKPAYIMAATGEVVTYKQLDDAANRLANLLRSSGFEIGDHIAICLENHPRFFEIIWGCHYAGLVYTACSSRLTSEELAYIINDCGAKGFITSKYKSDQAAEVVDGIPNAALRLMVDGTIAGFDAYEAAVSQYDTTPLDVRVSGMDMLYSSGTTGRPKGVKGVLPRTELTTQNGVANLAQLLFSLTQDAIYLSPAPLYHAAPLRFNLATMFTGATAIIMEHFDAEEYLQNVERFHVTHSQLVPTMFVRMLKLPEDVRSRYDLSSLKVAIHAAAPCPVEIKRQMIEWWGPILHEYYAGTEGNGFVYCNSEMWLQHPGTVGTAIQGVVHICDEEGNEVPQGESGTIFFESQAVFEYHNDPEKTKSSRDPQGRGWSTLGDVGYLDSDNFLYLTDRKAFMIISGGVNIYPQEAENILISHPRVVDVAVFGVPNDDFGEEVKAVVQPDVMPSSPDEAAALSRDIIAYCKSQLADLKCPRSVDFRTELPRHPTGKLYKRVLKDEYWQAAGRSI